MKKLNFREPNFKCKVQDASGNRYEKLMFAASQDELISRLQLRGLTIQSVEPYDFAEWRRRAARETERAIQATSSGQSYQFKASVWTELKNHLFELASGVCAYCEAKVQVVASGDVEHYRPKKKVEEDATHPGYYWLAYSVENLFPCCERCNRARGKMNHFPVSSGRARNPNDDLRLEKPLLLNPYQDDPARHLRFIAGTNGTMFGTVTGISDAGTISVKIYNLNREHLVEERRLKESQLRQLLGVYFASNKLSSFIHEFRSGKQEFSAAGLEVIRTWWKEQSSMVENELGAATPPNP